jgi:hypothetical protein
MRSGLLAAAALFASMPCWVWADGKDPAREIPLIGYTENVITAAETHTGLNGSSDLYSFFPKLGVVFLSRHFLNIDGAIADQSALHACCSFVS